MVIYTDVLHRSLNYVWECTHVYVFTCVSLSPVHSLSLCLSLSLPVIAVSFRCSLWPFNPQLRVKPWQMRWSSSGQNCKHSTTIFSRPPPHIHHSSPPPPNPPQPSFSSSRRLSSTSRSWRKSSFQTNVFYCVCHGNVDAHTHQIRNYNIGWTRYPFVSCLQRRVKQW